MVHLNIYLQAVGSERTLVQELDPNGAVYSDTLKRPSSVQQNICSLSLVITIALEKNNYLH